MLEMGITEVEGAANKPPVVGGWVLERTQLCGRSAGLGSSAEVAK